MFMQYSSNSPWGEIDCCEELYPGIYLVSTPSHGGVQVEWESAMLLSPAARKCGFLEGGFLWFEEDCCEQVVLRELLDRNIISKYNWKKGVCERIAIFEGALSNNGTKATPCLQGDIVGDWREEVLVRSEDNASLRLYVSTIPTEYRFHTFLEEPIYRISIATQNVGYNQPTQPGFYFGPDLIKMKGTFRGYQFAK